jgi:AraC-like DNA-binding protein
MFGSLLLLAFITLANPLRINKRGNFFFGIMLLLWASFWLEEICELAGIAFIPMQFMWLLQWIQVFAPLSLYLSIRFYSNPTYKFIWKDAKHLIVPILYLVLVWLSYNLSEVNQIASLIFPVLMFFQTFFYLVLSYIRTKQHREKLVRFESTIQGRDLNWLDYIIVQVLIISMIALVFNLLGRDSPGLIMNCINLIVVAIVAFHSLGQKEIFHVHSTGENALNYFDEPEDKRKIMSARDLNMQKERLTNLMSFQMYYLDSNLNLDKLANLLALTPHQLSHVINTGFNVNFFQFVNQYRIDKAKELLMNNSNNSTILAIAYESGFNSKTAFNTTFKKLTGQTPSGFMKQQSA